MKGGKIKILEKVSPGPPGWFRKESHPERAKDNGDRFLHLLNGYANFVFPLEFTNDNG